MDNGEEKKGGERKDGSEGRSSLFSDAHSIRSKGREKERRERKREKEREREREREKERNIMSEKWHNKLYRDACKKNKKRTSIVSFCMSVGSSGSERPDALSVRLETWLTQWCLPDFICVLLS
jgi:hypothetical protein